MRIEFRPSDLKRESLVSTFLRLFILGWLLYFVLFLMSEHFTVDQNLDFLLHDNFQNGDFDNFRDFFEVNIVAAGGNSYLTGECANYPPLALAIGKFFALFTPTPPSGLSVRDQAWEVRDTIPGMLLFSIVFAAFTASILYLFTSYLRRNLSEAKTDRYLAPTLAAMLTCSYCFVFLIERGNYIFIALLAFVVFVFTYRDNEVVSAVALAICACIKIYPVVLFLLYLFDKRYKGLLIGICTGIVGLFLPMLLLNGSFVEQFTGLLGGVLSFNGNSQATTGEIGFNFVEQHSNSFSNIFRVIAALCFGMGELSGSAAAVTGALSVVSTICLIVLVLASLAALCFTKTTWKRMFILYALLCLIPSNTYDYMLTFFLPILIMVLCGGKTEDRKYVILLTALACFPKNYFYIDPLILDSSIQCGINPLLMSIMLVLLSIESLKPVITRLLQKKQEAPEAASTEEALPEPVSADVL